MPLNLYFPELFRLTKAHVPFQAGHLFEGGKVSCWSSDDVVAKHVDVVVPIGVEGFGVTLVEMERGNEELAVGRHRVNVADGMELFVLGDLTDEKCKVPGVLACQQTTYVVIELEYVGIDSIKIPDGRHEGELVAPAMLHLQEGALRSIRC